jgi:hypothetical protein
MTSKGEIAILPRKEYEALAARVTFLTWKVVGEKEQPQL